ncbi:MAG TPA: amino acid ABC transporter permease [Acidothermaceae bacterium]|jgi:polar amino acid transport system permease protein
MTSDVETARERPETIRAVPVQHPGRWVAVVIIGVLIAMFAHMLVTNPNIEWHTVGHYLFSSIVMRGVGMTLELTALSMAIGIAIGVLTAVMRLSPNPVVSMSAWAYVWFFRGTPLLVQIIFWFSFATFIRRIAFGVPFGPYFWSQDTNSLITLFVSALLALALNEGAYMSEIVRAGILSVEEGQTEAAQALGMTRVQVMRRVVLPQAMRVIVPPTGNEINSMLKSTALVSTIGLADLLRSVQIIYNANYKTIPLLVVAIIWYLFMTSLLQVGQYYIERYYARGAARSLPPTPLQRARSLFHGGRPR